MARNLHALGTILLSGGLLLTACGQEPDLVNSVGGGIDTPAERTSFKTALELENVDNTLHNLTAVVDPVAGDDSGDGYSEGSMWLNTASGIVFICIDPTLTAAVWVEQLSVDAVQVVTNKVIDTASNTITVLSADVSDATSNGSLVGDPGKVLKTTAGGNTSIDTLTLGAGPFGNSVTLASGSGSSPVVATFPEDTGNVVIDTAIQTLTNKTLTTPVIATISNTGTLTLPTATTTLVGRDTTDTLTNKTINSASNTISVTSSVVSDAVTDGSTYNSGTGKLLKTDGSGVVKVNAVVSYDYFEMVPGADLRWTDGVNSATLTWSPSGIGNDVTMPVSPGVDVVVLEDTTQTLTNKTLDAPVLVSYERHAILRADISGAPGSQPTAISIGTASGLQFSSTGTETVYCEWEIPNDWDGGNVSFEIDWCPDSAGTTGTDTVKWDVSYRSIAEGETLTNGTATALSNTDDGDYAQYQMKFAPFTLAFNDPNQPLTAGDHVFLQISRDTGVANDFAGTVTVTAFQIVYNSVAIPTN